MAQKVTDKMLDEISEELLNEASKGEIRAMCFARSIPTHFSKAELIQDLLKWKALWGSVGE